MGPVCLPGAVCSALGLLWLCDLALADQVLDAAILPDQQAATGGANGKSEMICRWLDPVGLYI